MEIRGFEDFVMTEDNNFRMYDLPEELEQHEKKNVGDGGFY